MGRRKSSHFLPYEDAKEYTRKHGIKSRNEYWDWAKKIGFLPNHPHRHYKEHWVSWNDFLGTNNSFEASKIKPRNFRPYWDAVRWVQKAAKAHGLKTMNDWLEFYETGEVPRDIPKRPDQFYKEFLGNGWSVWLGKDIESILKSEKEQQVLLALCVTQGIPQNVITPVFEKEGIGALKERLIAERRTAIRLYKCESNTRELLGKIFAAHGRAHEGGAVIVPNVNALLFDTDSEFEMVRVNQ